MRKYSDRYDNPSENNYNIYKKNYIINKKDYLTDANKWPIKEGVNMRNSTLHSDEFAADRD